ncbi:MAG: hypothetical protein Q6364_12750 [Candidatus Hermodarchaeota archaeon]|nr:hypothetical protein [Candidatus Hermodarchaeota archaeon]
MKRIVQVSILLGIGLLVVAAYSHIYETSSTGMLPYIDYPLRPYTLPLFILGMISLVSGIVLMFYRDAK